MQPRPPSLVPSKCSEDKVIFLMDSEPTDTFFVCSLIVQDGHSSNSRVDPKSKEPSSSKAKHCFQCLPLLGGNIRLVNGVAVVISPDYGEEGGGMVIPPKILRVRRRGRSQHLYGLFLLLKWKTPP